MEKKYKKIPFIAPNGYFSSIKNDALTKVKHRQELELKQRNKIVISITSVAASLVIVLTSLVLYQQFSKTYNNSMTNDEIAEYLIEYGVSLEEITSEVY